MTNATTNGTTKAPATSGAEPTAMPVRRRAKCAPKAMPPKVAVIYSEDGMTVAVPLQGTFGAGKVMTLDALLWPGIASDYGEGLGLNFNGKRTAAYVCRGHRRVSAVARQRGERPKANLARIIAGAQRGQVVVYCDGDSLNLRRANLKVLSRKEALQWRRLRGHARALDLENVGPSC
jgi:hypothetical protein